MFAFTWPDPRFLLQLANINFLIETAEFANVIWTVWRLSASLEDSILTLYPGKFVPTNWLFSFNDKRRFYELLTVIDYSRLILYLKMNKRVVVMKKIIWASESDVWDHIRRYFQWAALPEEWQRRSKWYFGKLLENAPLPKEKNFWYMHLYVCNLWVKWQRH